MSNDGVRVLRILGRDYSVKAPAGEERALQEAAALLQAEIAAAKQKFPYVTSNELLLLSALNLCARQLAPRGEAEEGDERTVERLAALNRRIRAHLQAQD
ncbi:cell division protein ZapA (FtsZ GTPase activity inhibitor) [Pseudomonas citronellolis]|uniref:cell division protein ZapA n=1 Tax=Pseudomonas TaxID=286 RepID=UPI00209DDDB9|nr:cell division protein ZapA [Pseudomonas citronellolis]MCP1641066.1 cell division protein ZapA (FtsZ GTPase activity inhibitor) [Pseudomonas citronellolis]MCP1663984.1 cell division protein ZapA (FtsZ GTPase activity inhibitor) [Pseudomonas citronellolis]MCP1700653.1 cell division protein ZapA (FtsZ GTPase activity inhibitor) [Pseudomonas citronellolis]MCP1707038.1 cell division protein ZapA (FtsZ GTPase activity inhibitor) [Pseudomonas citronellolis]MCP1800821.1 cell division protein ZapA (